MDITKLTVAAACAAMLSGAQAHGDASHDPQAHGAATRRAEPTAFGRVGDPARATRTVRIEMADSMRFTPARIALKRGETVRFVVANTGQVLHEMVLGTPADLKHHAELMRKFPGMEHEEAHMTHVKPGDSGEIVWQFTRRGTFQFACLLPGHFEAGMVGTVTVE